MSEALAGIRALDFGDRSSALAGRILADLGAEVILVEPAEGSSIRQLAPFLGDDPGPERSFAHLYYNANKRSVVLESGQAGFDELIASADVIIDNGGLDAGRVRELNPGVILCSVTPFGLSGEWRDRKANDLVAGAAGGLVWLSGEARGRPVQGGSDPSYAMAGLTAASAVSIALHRRAEAGEGAHIDVSLQEATLMAAMQTATPSQWTWHNRVPRRPGLSNALRCADGGYVGLLVRPDRFDHFLTWLDHVGIEHSMTSADWEWSRLEAPRKDNPVAAATLALAAALGRDEFAVGALEIADIVCLPVLGFDDLERTEQYVVNDQFLTVHHDGLDIDLGFVRSPADAMADGVEIGPAPMLGQHQKLVDEAIRATRAEATAVAAGGISDPATALEGLRVVDFGWVLAGPIGTRILASFGAEVIRVESSTKPDAMRSQIGPDGTPDQDLGGLFNTVNAGKLSLSVDLTTDAGLQLIKDLIATADVVVNNFRPGAMERMGLGFEVLQSLKADIVSLNLPGAHRNGPWAVRASMGNILMAASGFNMLTGFEGERPRGIGVAYPDFTSPHLLTATILAAIRQRDRTGSGQELHLTQLSGVLSLLGAEWMHYKATGIQPPRKGNRDPNYCPHGVYPATSSEHSDDEWVALAVRGDDEWRAFCQVIGRVDLIGDSRFATHALRKRNEDELDAVVDAWTVRHDKWAAADLLQNSGIAAAPVEHLVDTYELDPQLRHHYQTVHQPSAPSIDIPIDREAAQWVGADHRIRRSPGLGEHNEHVVREILGRSEAEYLQLVLDDVLG